MPPRVETAKEFSIRRRLEIAELKLSLSSKDIDDLIIVEWQAEQSKRLDQLPLHSESAHSSKVGSKKEKKDTTAANKETPKNGIHKKSSNVKVVAPKINKVL